jgi:membrane protease YdiL (CAAX protease family)
MGGVILEIVPRGVDPVRPFDVSTHEEASVRSSSGVRRLEHISQSAPLRFAAAVLVGWFLAAGLAVGLWSAVTGDPLVDDGSQAAGRVFATTLLALFLYRMGWLEQSGITRSGPRRVWLVVALAVVYLVPAYVWGLFGVPGLESLRVAWDAFLGELPVGISVGIAEEFLFRGILLFVLVRAWGRNRTGALWAVLVTSVVFGLIHATPALVGEDLGYVTANLLGTIISAVWWAALVLTYRTVWPGVVIHTLTNSATLAVAEIAQQSSLGAAGSLRADLLELPWLIFGLWLLMDERRFLRRETVPA